MIVFKLPNTTVVSFPEFSVVEHNLGMGPARKLKMVKSLCTAYLVKAVECTRLKHTALLQTQHAMGIVMVTCMTVVDVTISKFSLTHTPHMHTLTHHTCTHSHMHTHHMHTLTHHTD